MSKLIGLVLLSLLALVVLRVAFTPPPPVMDADCGFGSVPSPPCYQVPTQCQCQFAALAMPKSLPF